MSKQTRTYQGGKIVAFGIIAAILALAVFAVIYFTVQRGEQVRQEQASAEAEKIAKEQSDKTPVAVVPEDQSAPAKESEVTAPQTAATAAELPVTGPEQDAATIFVLALLAASISAYIASRMSLRRTL